MRKRPFSPARALRPAAALLLTVGLLPSLRQAVADDDPIDPIAASETVNILDAQKAGDLDVMVRGTGKADHVRFTIANKSQRRLNVVLPPGLVAAATTGQGFQSMGLGVPTDQPGRFGQYAGPSASTETTGFRSMPPIGSSSEPIGVMPGQTAEFDLPSVCLNFGIPTPERKDVFTLMDVDDYTRDARARKALRSLAVLGTSQGVAQAVAWHVFNGMTYSQMAKLARDYINPLDISVAARFVEALDASGTHELVDPAYFREGRVLVRVRGEGGTVEKLAVGLSSELQGALIFGLPVQVVDELDANASRPSSILLDVQLTGEPTGRIGARAIVRHNSVGGGWTPLGRVDLGRRIKVEDLNGERLAEALDHAVASAFVTATPARRGDGTTTLRIVNRLPLTVENLVVRTGRDADAPAVTLESLGVGPFRTATATVQAPLGVVERVELNGL